MSQTRRRAWTVVQHSGYGYGGDPQFERGLEVRELGVHGEPFARELGRVKTAGGTRVRLDGRRGRVRAPRPLPGRLRGADPARGGQLQRPDDRRTTDLRPGPPGPRLAPSRAAVEPGTDARRSSPRSLERSLMTDVISAAAATPAAASTFSGQTLSLPGWNPSQRGLAERERLIDQARGTDAARQLQRCFPRWMKAFDHLAWRALVRLAANEPVDPNDPDMWAEPRRAGPGGAAPPRTDHRQGRAADAWRLSTRWSTARSRRRPRGRA